MAYRANPFLERMSERTSDQEFVRLFSPKILERLEEDCFEGAVHVFRSSPGGGKTTLLRAFTPTSLQAFWNARRVQEMTESYQRLVSRGVIDEDNGPQLLGVLMSCASGYADLPPGVNGRADGLFRALFDCRVVYRSLRSLATLLSLTSPAQLEAVEVEFDGSECDLIAIPRERSAAKLLSWAEQRERSVYAGLDAMVGQTAEEIAPHVRFEGVLWLQSARFVFKGKEVAPLRMLMIDDSHKLRRQQRTTIVEEITDTRPRIPVWVSERRMALGVQLLSQGVRQGRDLREYDLDELWTSGKGQHQFMTFGQNVLDRRLGAQSEIPPGAFGQYLQSGLKEDDVQAHVTTGADAVLIQIARYRRNSRYAEWVAAAEGQLEHPDLDGIRSVFTTCILLARDELKRQMSLDLAPLPVDELEERSGSPVLAAAEIFLHEAMKVPYYFGLDRLCVLATGNIEELLALGGALFDGLRARQVLRSSDLLLSAADQERLLREAAQRKLDFIPRNHTEGARARRLLDAIGSYCRERTFLPNAPYAPGVTGIRLSDSQRTQLDSGTLGERGEVLTRVLAESVAENLLVSRRSAATTGREGGTVFYLNRTLCVCYGLPLQMGGWQDISAEECIGWMESGRKLEKLKLLEMP